MWANLKWSSVLVVLVVVLAALPAAAQTASSLVTIGVPATQQLEGATSLTIVPTGSPSVQRNQLVVRSNTSWVLMARLTGRATEVAWRTAGTDGWQLLGATTVLLRGGKGVHAIDFEVRLGGQAQPGAAPAVLAFAVEAAN